MGRGRKPTDRATGKQRIQGAFWELLVKHPLREMTVGSIARRAGCKRGTFYYHYRDFDDLLCDVIEEELVGSGSVARIIFLLSTGQGCEHIADLALPRLERMGLIVRRGGFETALAQTRAAIMRLWQAVLCPDGQEMAPEVADLVTFNVAGILGMLVSADDGPEGCTALLTPRNLFFYQRNASMLLEHLSAVQGVPEREIVLRLGAVAHVLTASVRRPGSPTSS